MRNIEAEQLLRNTGFLRGLARSLLADPERADDVVQEAWVAALKRPPRAGVPLRSWLAAVVRNLAYRVGRDEARRARRERVASRREWVRPTADVVEAEAVRQEVVQALLSLEEPYRTVLLLRFYDDLQPREIAARLGVPGTTVRTRIKRGLEQMRGRLDAGRGGDRRRWCLALAAVAAAPPRSAIAAYLLAGGFTVMKAKIAAGVFLLLALGLLLYTQVDDRQAVRAPTEASHDPIERGGAATDSAPPAAVLPPPIDLEAVDIDRDIHGIVVREEDGLPVAGAEIQAVSYPWRRVFVPNMDGYWDGIPGPSTRSASDGTFKLRLRRGQLAGVRVGAAGRSRVEIPDVQAGERLRVELSLSTGLTVIVRDESGRPVEDAELRFLSRAGIELNVKGTTDVEGRFRGPDLPWSAAPVTVRAAHPNHGSGWRRILAGTAGVAVTVSKGRTITGRVTDAKTGAPVVNARVGMNWTLTNAVEVDAEGRYSLPGWTGRWVKEIAADAPAYAFSKQRVGEADSLDFRLEPGGSVVARVVDTAGHPLPGVYASAIGSQIVAGLQQTSQRHTTSGPDGRIRLDGLEVDLLHQLVLTKPGQGRTRMELRPPPPEKGPLDLGDVTMPPGLTIEGVVIAGDGSPATRTGIILAPRGRAPADFHANTGERRTDHLGRFRFPDQSPGSYTLEVRPRGKPYVRQDVELDGRDLLGIEIRLPEGREFVVFVEDAGGRPVPNVSITIWRKGGGSARRRTDESGRAAFLVGGPVPRVDCSVTGRAFLQPKPFLNVPENRSEVRFLLREAGSAAGQVIRPDGKPFPGALLEVRRGDDKYSTCSTNAFGEFEAQVPTDGPVDLVLVAMERNLPTRKIHDTNLAYEGTLRGVVAGAEGLVLRLRERSKEGSLVLRVIDPEGKPVGGVTFSVLPVLGFRSPTTDKEGRARIANLPVRELTILVNGRPGESLAPPVPVKVVPRGQEVVMRCRPGSVLTGVVLLPNGKPLVGVAQVTAQEGSVTVGFTWSGRGGRFTLHVPKEPVGTLRLVGHATTSEGKRVSGFVEPRPGENKIRLQLEER